MSNKTIYFYIIACFVLISNCFAVSDGSYKEGQLLVRFAPKIDGKQMMTAEREHLPGSLSLRVQAGNRVLKRYCKTGGDDYNVAFFGKPSL